jgi:dienelactone hydrolase
MADPGATTTLGIFGALDRGIRAKKVRASERCMNAAGKRVEIEIYDGAGHAFENPSNQRGYRPKAAAVAWFETLKFFEQANGSTSLSHRSFDRVAKCGRERGKPCGYSLKAP